MLLLHNEATLIAPRILWRGVDGREKKYRIVSRCCTVCISEIFRGIEPLLLPPEEVEKGGKRRICLLSCRHMGPLLQQIYQRRLVPMG